MSKDKVVKNGNGEVNMNFYKSIIENSPTGYAYHKIILDENNGPCDYEFIEVNIAFESLTGLKRIDILGKHITEVLPDFKKDAFNWIRFYGNIAINGGREEFEQFSEPLKRWYKVTVNSPEKYYFVTHFIDITNEKTQLDELQKNTDRLTNVLEGTNVGTWEWNVQTGETVLDERWAEIIGYTLEEISPVSIETWTRFVHIEDLNKSEAQLKRVFDRELDYYDIECRMKHKDGSWSWVQDRGKVTSWTADRKPIIVSGTHTDITERKRVEDDLQKSEYKLKEAQRLAHIGHWDWDYQKNTLSWSDEVFNIFGLAIGEFEVSTENFENAIHPEDLQFFLSEREKSLVAGNDVSIEHRIVRPDGEIRYVHERARIIRDVEENPLFILGTIQDTTERKQAEDDLRDNEFRFHMALECTNTGIWDWNMIKNEVVFSIEWKKMLGYDDHEVENTFAGWKNLWHPDDATSIEKALNDHLAGKTAKYEIIHRCRHKDGDWRWIVTRGEILKDLENKPYRWIGTNVDITEIKQIEAQLYQEKDQFKTTLLSVGDGIISTDAKGNVVILSPIAEQLTGWPQAEAVGRSIEEVFHISNEFTRERCDNPVTKVLDTGDIIELANHTLLISKDGFERSIENSAAPIKDAQGKITGVVLVFRDVTEKKKSRDEITYLSFHDYLTGLYNRRFFEAEVKRLDTERNLPFTIIMGDVNGLKLINDSFGHFAGDELLIRIAKILKKSFRAADIIARVGGDEYAILLPKTDGSEAQKLINRTLELLLKEKVRDLDLSISFGWATKTVMSQTTDLVTKMAEDYMYNNKLFEGPSVRGRVIDSIVATINAKSPREQAHSERVSELCVAIGEALKFEEGEIKTLKVFGLLHDIGKIAIDDDILNKADDLTDQEHNEIKRHSEIGFRILSTVNDMSEIADYVLCHHERWDGKGYPKGLAGDSIPLPSRICAIADAYDAMTSDRSYRPALTHEFAVEELQKNSGTQFDPKLVVAFLQKVLPKLSH